MLGRRVLRAFKATLGRKAFRVYQGLKGCRETPDNRDRKVIKVRQALICRMKLALFKASKRFKMIASILLIQTL